MPKTSTLSPAERETLDRFYREGGLRAMASPHVRYDDRRVPIRAACIAWMDRLQLELHGDPEGVYEPLIRTSGLGLR